MQEKKISSGMGTAGIFVFILIVLGFVVAAYALLRENTEDVDIPPPPDIELPDNTIDPTKNGSNEEAEGLEPGGNAYVDTVDVLIMESFPLQAAALISGHVSDACTQITDARVVRNSTVFTITLTTGRPPEAMCAQVLTPFEKRVTLDIYGLPAGTYTVVAGETETNFSLNTDNTLP